MLCTFKANSPLRVRYDRQAKLSLMRLLRSERLSLSYHSSVTHTFLVFPALCRKAVRTGCCFCAGATGRLQCRRAICKDTAALASMQCLLGDPSEVCHHGCARRGVRSPCCQHRPPGSAFSLALVLTSGAVHFSALCLSKLCARHTAKGSTSAVCLAYQRVTAQLPGLSVPL